MSTPPGNRRVMFVQYTDPAAYPPLCHATRILMSSQWQILHLGTTAGRVVALYDLAFAEVKRLPYCPPGFRQKVHYLYFVLWVAWWVVRWRPAFVYASEPLSGPAVLLARMILRFNIIYHEHDSPAAPSRAMERVTHFFRRAIAKRAGTCVLPNAGRVEAFRKAVGDVPVLCVWNCPMLDEVADRTPYEQFFDDFRLVYQGSVVPPRLPLQVIEALAHLPSTIKLAIVGFETPGHLGYKRELAELARALNVEDRISFFELTTRREVLSVTRSCHAGLSLMPLESSDVNMKFMAGASNKIFEYMASGLPVIASDSPEWRALVADNGIGVLCRPDAARSIAECVERLYRDRESAARMGERGRFLIRERWNYEHQFAPVMDHMNSNPQSRRN